MPQYQHNINDLGLLYISSSGVNGSSGSGGIVPNPTPTTGSTGTAAINAVVPLTAVTTLEPGTRRWPSTIWASCRP